MGFNPTLEILASQICKDLHNSRLLGRSSPSSPVKSDVMCVAYKKNYDWDVTDVEVRKATKYLVERKKPIGSTLSGYYYVLKSSEWKETKNMLMPKFISLKSKIDLINEMEKEMAEKEQGQIEMPMLNLLTDKLNLEKI